MARKGYYSEYKAKRELIDIWGKPNVIKVAIGGATDFIVVCQGKIIKVVEVKEAHKKKYYPRPNEKEQMRRIKEFAEIHGIRAEVWIYKYKDKGKVLIKEKQILYEVK